MAITYHAGRRIQGLSTDLTESIRQGYDGGNGYNSEPYLGGGGGGAGEVGESISSGTTCATGGDGLQSDIWQGNSIYYAGGGGATSVRNSTTGGAGGQGGGGAGGSASNGVAGTDYLGGGGGATWDGGYGGVGGKGVVILQFTTSGTSFSTTGSPSSDTSVSGKTTLKYTSTGTFVISSGTPDVRYLVIGGGGGGCSGGGGAGGFRTGTLSLSSSTGSSGTHTVTVGTGSSGGNGGSNTPATNGLDSVFDTITSIGGGGGGGAGSGSGLTGGTGGSGGGAGKNGTVGSGTVTVNDLKPANVQVGSRLEETDTRKMYNYTEGLQFEDNFSDFTADTTVDGTEVNGWTPNDASQAWIDEGTNALQFNQTNESSNNAIVFDMQSSYGMGTNVSDTKWRLDYTSNLSSFSGTQNQSRHWFGLASGAEDVGLQTAQDAIWIHCSPYGSDWGVDTSDNAVAPQATGTSLTFATSTDYFWSLIRDGDTVTAYRWTDGTRTSAAQTSTQDISAKTITNLRYIKYSNRNQTSVGGVAGAIKDISFYNGVTDTTSNVWKEIGT
jgi:hypothetical protein